MVGQIERGVRREYTEARREMAGSVRRQRNAARRRSGYSNRQQPRRAEHARVIKRRKGGIPRAADEASFSPPRSRSRRTETRREPMRRVAGRQRAAGRGGM